MKNFSDRTAYESHLESIGGLPRGFVSGVCGLDFYPVELTSGPPYKMNLSMIRLEEPTSSFAGVFTRNCVKGAPVIENMARMKQPYCSGVVINNKIANVCSCDGMTHTRTILGEAEKHAELPAESCFLMASTGIIGWRLPVMDMVGKLEELNANCAGKNALNVSKAIMTTDAFPKIRSIDIEGGRILGIAKGAGMIEPNMGTMLVFLLTDIQIEREVLRKALAAACNNSFNCITLDGDQSTSDMALAFSSNIVTSVDTRVFTQGLESLCIDLAKDIVRNGEGTAHVIELRIDRAASAGEAACIGKAVCNSPLVKTAIFGNDPNVGRLIAAVGDAAGNSGLGFDVSRITITMGGRTVFQDGCFRLGPETEETLCRYLKAAMFEAEKTGYPEHQKMVEIVIDLNRGNHNKTFWGSDFSYEYVRENADYRT